MRIHIDYSRPTCIRTIDDYLDRTHEIFCGHIRDNAFVNHHWVHWLFFFWTLPLALIYSAICIAEFILDTLLLPLSLIPIIRAIPILLWAIFYGVEVMIGFLGGISADISDTPDRERSTPQTNKQEQKAREALATLRIDMTLKSNERVGRYAALYGKREEYAQLQDTILPEMERVRLHFEEAYGLHDLYCNGTESAILYSFVQEHQFAVGIYYLFELDKEELDVQKETAIEMICVIFREKKKEENSPLDSKIYHVVRNTLLHDIKYFKHIYK